MEPTVYIVPIEPLPERYTESWYRNIPKGFKEFSEAEVVVIDGETLTDCVKVGAFLDMNSTVYYKNSQMQKIAKMFHDGTVKKDDVFFFGDLEFWGIESVRLMSQLNNVPVKLTGFLHAASYTVEDAFAVAEPYQKYTEIGWLVACDWIFVGSYYHKNAIIQRRIKPIFQNRDVTSLSSKIIVSGNPLFEDDYKKFPVQKKNKLILPNRFDWEKRPNLSLDMAYILKRRNPSLEIVVTTSRPQFRSNKQWLVDLARNMEKDGIISIKENLTKDEYHLELAESKVMLTNSIEENFGYCLVEASLYGCCPVAPKKLSHTELLCGDSRLLFDDEDEVVSKVEHLLKYPVENEVIEYASVYFKSMQAIVDHIFS